MATRENSGAGLPCFALAFHVAMSSQRENQQPKIFEIPMMLKKYLFFFFFLLSLTLFLNVLLTILLIIGVLRALQNILQKPCCVALTRYLTEKAEGMKLSKSSWT